MFVIVRLPARQREVLADGAEHLVRFLEEDRQQFRIDLLARRLRQPQGLGRGCGHFHRRHGGDAGDRLLDVAGHCLARRAGQCHQCRPRFFLEPDVGDQAGILPDVFQVLLEVLAHPFILGRFAQRLDQHLGFALLLLQLGLDGRRRGLPGFLFGRRRRPGLHRLEDLVQIGGAMLQGLDEEAESGQVVRHRLEFLLRRQRLRVGEGLDAGFAVAQQGDRLVLPHDHQRALDLLERAGQRRQFLAPARVAEEGIEGLLDLGQVGENLPRHLAHHQAFLGAPRHVIEERRRKVRERLPAHQGAQPVDDDFHLLRKVGPQLFVILQGIFGQQQGGGDFHRRRIVLLERILAQPLGGFGNAGHQSRQMIVDESAALARQGDGMVMELRQRHGRAGAELVPGFLGRPEGIAHGPQHRLERLDVRRSRRHQRV